MAGLSGIFFLSGCAALLFESLWFRQTLLAFGSSVWASSLVLSSFMAGVALGNAGAARLGTRLRRPVLAFALLELTVGALGISLVLLLPLLGPWLAPLFRPLLGSDALLQPLRFAVSFALLLGPAVAMGATLPLLVGALSRRPEDFGTSFGALYGWNALGGVVGAVAGEVQLLSLLGVVGTGAVAVSLNLLAALAALVFVRLKPAAAIALPEVAALRGISGFPARLLGATFLCGGILLALEVVWFRLLLLFVDGTSRAFAVMLGVILAGLALGSLTGALWMRRDPGANRHAWSVALAAGALGIFGYGVVGVLLPEGGAQLELSSPTGLAIAAALVLPVSASSGLLFALLGKSLNDRLLVPIRSAGLLAFCNTIGAALGPLLAGFVLLPRAGMEISIWLLCAGYAVVALLCSRIAVVRAARLAALPALAFLGAIACFPFGRMANTYLPLATHHLLWPGAEIVAQREGLTETIQVSRLSFQGEPIGHQLLTNGYRMSGSGIIGRRYMSLFIHLPVAFHPAPRDALLISYGVGNTAQSLTRVAGMRSIDVVDISREILEMSEVIFPDPQENPLRDPRVTVHLEDGRYFLQTTRKSFDLITGEPPPPRLGHVTYLYTQEYFQLTHDRLRPGGLVSYWLPVDQLSREEAASITAGFCAVFEDCSMWNGGSLNWILLGSRGGLAPLASKSLGRQWIDPTAAADLRAIGVESPEALGALFIADAEQLQAFAMRAPPVRDAFPLRIHNQISTGEADFFVDFQQASACQKRFARSDWIRQLWPNTLRGQTLREFTMTAAFNRSIGVLAPRSEIDRLLLLRHALEGTTLETLPLLALGGDPLAVEIARRKRDEVEPSAEIELNLAMGALAQRAWGEAAAHYQSATSLGARAGRPRRMAVYAACRAGDRNLVDALRRELFDNARDRQVPRGLLRNRGIDGCWAAAWDPNWAPAE